MSDREIEAMHGKPVIVLTHDGQPVSLGRVRVSRPLNSAAMPRIEIVFETETLACALRVRADRVGTLYASFDGHQFRHHLPESNRVWVSDQQAPSNSATTAMTADVETFPLPPQSRLGGPAPRDVGPADR